MWRITGLRDDDNITEIIFDEFLCVFLHFVSMIADPTALLIIQLAVVPYYLQIVKKLLHKSVFVSLKLRLHGAQVHRVRNYLVVVRQALRINWRLKLRRRRVL